MKETQLMNLNQTQLDDFIARYIGMWDESDAERRHDIVHDLWSVDAENITRRFTARGMAEIIARVDRAHQEWVASKGFMFRPAGNNDTHNNLVKFFWEMLPRGGGPIEARGLDIFVLNDDGRIKSLYQFSEQLDVKASG
jgi:hypothetical protein